VDEEPLVGGNWTAQIVRIGDTVHRSREHGSKRAARVLLALERASYPFAPRYLGQDPDGRDVLTYVPGATTSHPSERDESAYAAGGRMLRMLHDLTTGSPEAEGEECVLHGDPGPFNTIFVEGMPVALIDWDSTRPGRRADDLAYMAWTWCIQSVGAVPVVDQARRVAQLQAGYRLDVTIDLLAEIDAQQSRMIAISTELLARLGENEGFYAHQKRAIDWATADRALLRENRAAFAA
jgi:hypothetical protein